MLDYISVVLATKALFLSGLSLWFTLAIINNLTDPETNIHLIGQMMRMDLIKEDPIMGNRLQWRAVNSSLVHKMAFSCVVLAQIVTVILLWRASIAFFGIAAGLTNATDLARAIYLGNLGLGAFAAIWICFWTGGLWFGYWMKTPQIQQVHMMLLIMSMCGFLFVNLPVQKYGQSLSKISSRGAGVSPHKPELNATILRRVQKAT